MTERCEPVRPPFPAHQPTTHRRQPQIAGGIFGQAIDEIRIEALAAGAPATVNAHFPAIEAIETAFRGYPDEPLAVLEHRQRIAMRKPLRHLQMAEKQGARGAGQGRRHGQAQGHQTPAGDCQPTGYSR